MSDKDIPKIYAEVSFNYDDDKKEFGEKPRMVSIFSSISEEGVSKTSISFDLGRKEDDDFLLTFDTEELIQKIARAIAFGENFMKE